MTDPVTYLELELSPGVWTTVHDEATEKRLRRTDINRGKQRALDHARPGSAVFVLSNNDRHFDPEVNPTFANLRPGTPVRLRAEYPSVYTDTFDRADSGDLGAPWVEQGGANFGIFSNRAYKIATDSVHQNATLNFGVNRGTATVTINSPFDAFISVVGRYVDESNHWFVQGYVGGNILYLVKVEAGVLTAPTSVPMVIADGDRIGIECDGDIIKAIHNGDVILTHDTLGVGPNGNLWGIHLFANGTNGTIDSFEMSTPVSYTLFTGKLSRIIDQSNGPHDATQTWEAYDGLADLAAVQLSDVWRAYMAPRDPRIWLPFSDTSGSIVKDRTDNHRDGTHPLGATPEFGVAGLFAATSETATKIDGTDYVILPVGTFPTTLPWTLNLFFEALTNPVGNSYLLTQNSYPNGLAMWIDSAGRINVEIRDGATVTSARSLFGVTGAGGIVTINARAGLPLRIMLGSTFDWSENHVGTGGAIPADVTSTLFAATGELTLQHLTVFDSSTTPDEENELASAIQAWLGDSANSRVTRLRDIVGWDHANSSTDLDGWSFLHGTDLGTTALEHYQAIVSSVEGQMWVDGAGKLWAYSGRALVHTFDASVATYSDAPPGLPYTALSDATKDWELLTNTVRRHHLSVDANSFNIESTISVSDSASIASYGPRDSTPIADVDSELVSLSAEYDLAAFRLTHYKDPREYIDNLAVTPHGDPDLWPRVLADDLGMRITIEHTPQGIGSPKVLETIIEGISHTFTPKRWTTKYNLDSTNAQRYFLFDDTLWDSPDWRFSA